MANAIHIEVNLLFLLILVVILYQFAVNVNQEMSRRLLRFVLYGITAALFLDSIWVLIDGRHFPGAYALNLIINAVFLSCGSVIACIWYLYVLETMGYRFPCPLSYILQLVSLSNCILNLLSIKTGWFFSVGKEDNIYYRGPFFWVQTLMTVGVMMIALFHIIIRLIRTDSKTDREPLRKLLRFYLVPVIGTIIALPFTGMPGTWTCSAVSIVMMYIETQDKEIVRDSLTGLNNRKMLPSVFSDYVRQVSPELKLFLFMMDLDKFKYINDTFGHPAGDQALMDAASVFRRSVGDIHAMIARVGGDEFLIMTLLPSEDDAVNLKKKLEGNFEAFNREKQPPYLLTASIGFHAYEEGQSLEKFIEKADESLYLEKARRRNLRAS